MSLSKFLLAGAGVALGKFTIPRDNNYFSVHKESEKIIKIALIMALRHLVNSKQGSLY